MRNIVHINCSDTACNGVSSFSTDTNELILSILPLPSQKTNIRLNVVASDNNSYTLTIDNLNQVMIPTEYWNATGTMIVKVISDEDESDDITFTTTLFTSNNDVYITSKDDVFIVNVCTGSAVPTLKRISEKTITDSVTSVIPFSIEYNAVHDLLDVFVNRFKLIENSDYSVSQNTITFSKELDAGALVQVVVCKIA